MEVQVEPCPCGRTGFRFRHLGRSDDMFIVKGVNVFPLAVQAVVATLRPRLTGEFQIVLERPPPIDYEPLLRIEVAAGVPAAQHGPLAAQTRESLRRQLNFSARVELLAAGAITTEKKTRRLYRLYQGDRLP
jgi:phenylacetate-CoA ligase